MIYQHLKTKLWKIILISPENIFSEQKVCTPFLLTADSLLKDRCVFACILLRQCGIFLSYVDLVHCFWEYPEQWIQNIIVISRFVAQQKEYHLQNRSIFEVCCWHPCRPVSTIVLKRPIFFQLLQNPARKQAMQKGALKHGTNDETTSHTIIPTESAFNFLHSPECQRP